MLALYDSSCIPFNPSALKARFFPLLHGWLLDGEGTVLGIFFDFQEMLKQ